MNHRKFYLLFGTRKKGLIFTLDILMAVAIAFVIVIVSLFFVSRASQITISEHQILRISSDIVNLMDAEKIFDSLDYETIEIKLQELLPPQYNMLLRIQGNFAEGNGVIEVGGELPENSLIISGQRAAFTDSNVYLKITFFSWVRGSR